MISKIAQLQQQLNEQQKLLEAATQVSGCPSIHTGWKGVHMGPLVQHCKGKGPGDYRMLQPGSNLGSIRDCGLPKSNRGPSNMPKDKHNNNKNAQTVQEQQLSNN